METLRETGKLRTKAVSDVLNAQTSSKGHVGQGGPGIQKCCAYCKAAGRDGAGHRRNMCPWQQGERQASARMVQASGVAGTADTNLTVHPAREVSCSSADESDANNDIIVEAVEGEPDNNDTCVTVEPLTEAAAAEAFQAAADEVSQLFATRGAAKREAAALKRALAASRRASTATRKAKEKEAKAVKQALEASTLDENEKWVRRHQEASNLLQGTPYSLVDVEADGNCLYRAAATALNISTTDRNDIHWDFNTLKSAAMDELASNRHRYEDPENGFHYERCCTGNFDDIVSFDKEMELLLMPDSWGTGMALSAIAAVTNRTFLVYTVDTDPDTPATEKVNPCWCRVDPGIQVAEPVDDASACYLFYHVDLHYEVLSRSGEAGTAGAAANPTAEEVADGLLRSQQADIHALTNLPEMISLVYRPFQWVEHRAPNRLCAEQKYRDQVA